MCHEWYDETLRIERMKRTQRTTEALKQQAGSPAAAKEPGQKPEPGKQAETQPEAIPA